MEGKRTDKWKGVKRRVYFDNHPKFPLSVLYMTHKNTVCLVSWMSFSTSEAAITWGSLEQVEEHNGEVMSHSQVQISLPSSPAH